MPSPGRGLRNLPRTGFVDVTVQASRTTGVWDWESGFSTERYSYGVVVAPCIRDRVCDASGFDSQLRDCAAAWVVESVGGVCTDGRLVDHPVRVNRHARLG